MQGNLRLRLIRLPQQQPQHPDQAVIQRRYGLLLRSVALALPQLGLQHLLLHSVVSLLVGWAVALVVGILVPMVLERVFADRTRPSRASNSAECAHPAAFTAHWFPGLACRIISAIVA